MATGARKAARVPPDTTYHRRSAALTLLQMAHKWEPFYGPTGQLLWKVPSERSPAGGRSGAIYIVWVEQRAEPMVSCTCPDYTYPRPGRVAGAACKHIIAVRTYQRAVKAHERHLATLAAATGGSHHG